MRAIRRLVPCVLVLVLVLVSDRVFALENSVPTAIGPEGGWITALAVSPSFASDGNVWAAAFGGRIFASKDAAASWSESHSGESDPVVEGLAVSPNFSSDRTVLAAADEGVFKSADGGSTWTVTSAGLGHHFCRALVVSPSFAVDHTVFVATDSGVYRSSDGGASWSPPAGDTHSVISLAEVTNGSSAGTLYAGLEAGGMEQSTDAGQTWQSVPAFASTLKVLSILPLGGSSSSEIIAATDDGIWRSGDSGLTWLQAGAAGDRVDTLAEGPQTISPAPLYAGSAGGHGVYASLDSGATWSRTGAPAVPYVTTLVAAGASTLIAGTTGGGISMSTDGGSTWKKSSNGLFAMQVSSLKAVGGKVLVGGNGGAYLWDSSGGAWQALPLSSHFINSVDGLDRTVFAGTQDTGLLISNDAGTSWRRAALSNSTVSQVALSPPNGKSYTLLVAADYVYRSVDGGASFSVATTLAGSDVRSFSFSPTFASDGTIFAGTLNHGVYRSTDGGSTWLPVSSALPSAPITSVLTSLSFQRDHTVYAATAGNGVYISSNGGDTWSPVSPAIPNAVVDALAWTQSGKLVAGTEHGLYLLGPSGWSQLGNGWDGYVSTVQVVIDQGTEYLFAGTTGQGVWQLALGPVVPTASATPTSVPIVSTPAAATATPLAARSPTSSPTPKSTPVSHPLTLHLRVDPAPVAAGRPALLSVRGPAGGHIQLHLDAHSWHRKFSGTLGKDGRTAYGFVSPPTTITVVAQVTLQGRTAAARLQIPVKGN